MINLVRQFKNGFYKFGADVVKSLNSGSLLLSGKNFDFKRNFNSQFPVMKHFSDLNSAQPNLNIAENEEEIELRQIQMNPKYEAGIGFFVTGDYDRAVKNLTDLKNKLKEDNAYLNDDYLFLLKKIVSINKVNKKLSQNVELMNEIKEISERIYKHDFSLLFENLEFCIINLNNHNPSLTISFIDDVIEDNAFPPIFEHILIYYKASSYVLEGKNLETANELFESIENKVDDKYLKGCLLNNKNCATWWTTFSKHASELHKKQLSYDFLQNMAKDVLKIVKVFKEALINIEDISNFKFEDKVNYNPNLNPTEENLEEVRLNFLKFILSINFDLQPKQDSNFLKQMAANKVSLTKIKTSAIIFSNLGEFYYNLKEYKKSLIFLNVANLFFQNFSNNDPLFYKNLSLVAMNSWKLTNKPDGAKQMFEKILSQIKQYQPNYEKVFIFRIYGEMLLEENNQSVLGNNLIDEANKMEEKLPYFECRNLYLTLPSES